MSNRTDHHSPGPSGYIFPLDPSHLNPQLEILDGLCPFPSQAVTEKTDSSHAEECEGCGFGDCRNRDISIGFTKVGQYSLVKSCEGNGGRERFAE